MDNEKLTGPGGDSAAGVDYLDDAGVCHFAGPTTGNSSKHRGPRAGCPICRTAPGGDAGVLRGEAITRESGITTCPFCGAELTGEPWKEAFEGLEVWLKGEISRLEKWRPRTPSGYREEETNLGRLLALRAVICRLRELRHDGLAEGNKGAGDEPGESEPESDSYCE